MKASEQRRRAKERFAIASRIEREYLRKMNRLVNQIDHMIREVIHTGMGETELDQAQRRLQEMLKRYGQAVEPWAEAAANKILLRIQKVEENS